jgi:hypothetical protein
MPSSAAYSFFAKAVMGMPDETGKIATVFSLELPLPRSVVPTFFWYVHLVSYSRRDELQKTANYKQLCTLGEIPYSLNSRLWVPIMEDKS